MTAQSAAYLPASSPPWLLVFDLDGTLIDSSLDLCLAVNAAMSHVGAPELPHTLITGYIGDGAAMLIRRALGDPGDLGDLGDRGDPDSSVPRRKDHRHVFESAFGFFLDFYRKHKLDNTSLYDGVLDTLRAIRSRHPDLPMAVLTNKPVIPSHEICEALGVASFFFAIYGGNSFQTKKPDPAGLHTLMDEARALWSAHKVDPRTLHADRVVMIGDSETDVLTARRSGSRSLGCRYGLAPHTLDLAKPDLLCEHPSEWPGLLHL